MSNIILKCGHVYETYNYTFTLYSAKAFNDPSYFSIFRQNGTSLSPTHIFTVLDVKLNVINNGGSKFNSYLILREDNKIFTLFIINDFTNFNTAFKLVV